MAAVGGPIGAPIAGPGNGRDPWPVCSNQADTPTPSTVTSWASQKIRKNFQNRRPMALLQHQLVTLADDGLDIFPPVR